MDVPGRDYSVKRTYRLEMAGMLIVSGGILLLCWVANLWLAS